MILARYLVLLILLLSIQINQFSFALFSGHLQYIILCSSLISFFFFSNIGRLVIHSAWILLFIFVTEKNKMWCVSLEEGKKKKKKKSDFHNSTCIHTMCTKIGTMT